MTYQERRTALQQDLAQALTQVENWKAKAAAISGKLELLAEIEAETTAKAASDPTTP